MKYTDKTAFHCTSEEEFGEMLNLLTEEGYTGLRSNMFDGHHDSIGYQDGCLQYCYESWYREHGYIMLEASDVLNKTPTYEIY